MIYPNLNTNLTTRDFIKSLIEINQKRSGIHSIRNMARLLKWSASYLSDLSSGRRRLTLERAVEMAMYLHMTEHEIDQLMVLVMLESRLSRVRELGMRRSLKHSFRSAITEIPPSEIR